MDIESLKVGDKLKCINNDKNNWGGCDQVSGNLILNEIYTLGAIEIHSWHTKLWFKEVPDLKFNSVHFEKVGD